VSLSKPNDFFPSQSTYVCVWFHFRNTYSNEGEYFSGGKSHFLSDDEFGRQVLAGLNPLSIERLKVNITITKHHVNIEYYS
jgi:hypothetical protein